MKRVAAILLAAALGGCGNEVPVLLYHWVDAGTDLPWDASVEQFRAHMDELRASGFHTVTLQQVYDAMDGRGELPDDPVVITFDDGEVGVYRHAFPILRERGMVAELFVVDGLIGEDASSRRTWRVGEAELSMAVWPELREMAASGVFRIESHSETHPRLATIPLEEARREIVASRALISARLGRPVDFFAYPAHSVSAEVMDAVEEAGYRGAVAGSNRIGGRFAQWRISVFRSDGVKQLRQKLARTWADDWAQ